MKKHIEALETNITAHIDLTKKQQEEAQARLQELQEEPDDDGVDDDAQRALAIQEVEKQSQVIEADQVSCGVVFSQLQSEQTGQQIGNVLTSANSIAIVGLPTSIVGKIHQKIGDVTTEKNSVSMVGVYDGNINMRDLMSKRST